MIRPGPLRSQRIAASFLLNRISGGLWETSSNNASDSIHRFASAPLPAGPGAPQNFLFKVPEMAPGTGLGFRISALDRSRKVKQQNSAVVDGIRWQGMSTAAVQSPEPSAADGVVITDSCIRRLKELQAEEKTDGKSKMLRLSVEGGGCSGFLYNFSLDNKQNSDDRLFEKDGVTIIVDEISLSFVKGSTVDFSEELIRASFTVSSNPNASSGCGCGASFTAK